MSRIIKWYTDGACSGNPGPGGWAIVIVTCENDKDNVGFISGNKSLSTNNEMELTAFEKALEMIINLEVNDQACTYEIYTDSAYIHNCFKDEWYKYWETHNWKNKSRQEIKNKVLWQSIIAKLHQFEKYRKNGHNSELFIYKVEGHADDYYNNLADKYAVAARKEI